MKTASGPLFFFEAADGSPAAPRLPLLSSPV